MKEDLVSLTTPYACFTDMEGVMRMLEHNTYWNERKKRLKDEWTAMMKCIADAYERKAAEMTKGINPVYLTFAEVLAAPHRCGSVAGAIIFSHPVPAVSVGDLCVTFPDGSMKKILLSPAYAKRGGKNERIIEILSTKNTDKLESIRNSYEKTSIVDMWCNNIRLGGTEDIDEEGSRILRDALLKHVTDEKNLAEAWLNDLNEIIQKEL